jgi:transposase
LLEGSWGNTLDDRQMLRMLRYFNRSGSMYREVVLETPFKSVVKCEFQPNPAATSNS